MNSSHDINFLEKLKKRNKDILKVKEVYQNSELSIQVFDFLKKQTYLDFSKINIILNNIYDIKFPYGNVLLDQKNEIIGFLGTMISIRINENKNYTLCNLHTWIVNESHRLNSYLLLTPLLEKNYAITTFTPLKTLVGLYEKFGFQKIKMNYKIVFLFNFLSIFKKKKIVIEKDKSKFLKYLNTNELKIYQDHKNLSCLTFLILDIKNPHNKSFIVALKKRKKFFSSLDLIYVSNSKLLKDNWLTLSFQIALNFKVIFSGQNFLNKNFSAIPDNILISKNFSNDICVKDLPKNYKFDTLYSEFVY